MTKVLIPSPEELADRLNGLHVLLTATKWERAAIVYAFTDVGGPRNTPYHHPAPPKVTIRQFAARGYSGLHSVKAVQRYRRAWEYAMWKGWAVASEPAQKVEIPDEPFPSWDDMPALLGRIKHKRSGGSHFLTSLSTIRYSLGRCVAQLANLELDDELRDVLIGYADAIETDARNLRDIAAKGA